MTRFAMALGVGTAALLAGCGGSNPPAAATTTTTSAMMSSSGMSTTSGMEMSENTSCAPSGTTLQLSAKDTKYSTECLAAPAGQAFTIHFDNMDPLPHNVSIYSADPMMDKAAKTIFRMDPIMGPKVVDYSVTAQPAGRYHYHCDVHPTQMYGTLVVK
jgi:plastocyanin